MKGFFIKKAFFDGWDNLIGMALLNLIFIAIFMGILSVLMMLADMTALALVLLAALIFVFCVLTGGLANAAYEWSNYQSSTFSAFKEGIARNIRHSLLYFGIIVFQLIMLLFVMPFYSGGSSLLSLFISVLLFWFEIVFLLAIPYYFPLMSRLPADRPFKSLKKCFIILLDNIGFSIFFFIYSAICLVLSALTFGLIPGVAGMALARQDAMKLLMLKYDYLDENKDAERKNIPWDEILYEEREKIGPRTLKNMIFPWK